MPQTREAMIERRKDTVLVSITRRIRCLDYPTRIFQMLPESMISSLDSNLKKLENLNKQKLYKRTRWKLQD